MADILLNKKTWNLDKEKVFNIWDHKKKQSKVEVREIDPDSVADEISDRLIKIVEKEFKREKKRREK
jgi:hypothetical protein